MRLRCVYKSSVFNCPSLVDGNAVTSSIYSVLHVTRTSSFDLRILGGHEGHFL